MPNIRLLPKLYFFGKFGRRFRARILTYFYVRCGSALRSSYKFPRKSEFGKKSIKHGLSIFILILISQGTIAATAQVGTPENPTIEGGMLNTAIKKESPNILSQKAVLAIENKPLSKKVSSEIKTHTRIQITSTDWISNTHVNKVLHTAAKQGKLSYVLQKAEEKGLPASVAIIPMVESRYDTQAVSSKGAAGAWQLMPAVAKDYGIDNKERFDFETSTDVALQYLKDLHARWKNWDLVLAAYNAGSSRVLKAIRRRPDATAVEELDLPQETKTYIRRVKSTHQALGDMVWHET